MITFNENIVDLDELIYEKYKRGDRFIIQYKINYNKPEEYVTRENITYLEMMYIVDQ